MIRLAIDGPAASGKSAVGAAVAAHLGLPFIDTGLMYRALTWLALQRGVASDDPEGLTALAAAATLEFRAPTSGHPRSSRVFIDGLDATPHLRDPTIDRNVSRVSAVPGVRARLVELQRRLAGSGVVMAGRDIGTVVLPNADVKVFLDASPEERARRRQKDLQAAGEPAEYAKLLAEMRRRDHLDSTRAVAPLRPAADAVRLVTDGLGLAEVVERVAQLIAAQSCRSKAGPWRRHGLQLAPFARGAARSDRPR